MEHWKPGEESVYLIAGGAFAKGLEVARQAYYEGHLDTADGPKEVSSGDADLAIALGIEALLRAYGDFDCPPTSAKSAERTLCGGEAQPVGVAEALLARSGELWNMYGPTETTVWSTCARIRPGQGDIVVGRPIANTWVQVLDESGEPAPIGVPGEIWIGGRGVALGYHARPELTVERFRPDPAHPGATWYRTGDLGRWRSDGELQHLGRLDQQVKVRGYRIETGEIEHALARHPAIAQAAVVAAPGPDGDARLVAYVVAGGAEPPDATALRAHLRIELPDYMIPALYVPLAQLPLTPNGKLDRRALPAPEAPAPASGARRDDAPRTPAELAVAQVWRELVGVEAIGLRDNFLDLGGHSLLIMRAVALLEARTGARLRTTKTRTSRTFS